MQNAAMQNAASNTDIMHYLLECSHFKRDIIFAIPKEFRVSNIFNLNLLLNNKKLFLKLAKFMQTIMLILNNIHYV